jgi:hypothetical protein
MSEWSKQGFHLEHYYEVLALTNADLYEGRPREAHERVAKTWTSLRRSLLRTIQMVAVASSGYRGRAALALAREDASRRRELLDVAAWAARDLARTKVGYATPQSELLRAGIAAVADRPAIEITTHLRAALAGFDASDLALHASASPRASRATRRARSANKPTRGSRRKT